MSTPSSSSDIFDDKVRLLYRIGLSLNTATPLALFVRIELLCFSSCIRQQTCVATNTAIAAQIMTIWFHCSRGNGYALRLYTETIGPAILKSVQDKLIKQGHKELITFLSANLKFWLL